MKSIRDLKIALSKATTEAERERLQALIEKAEHDAKQPQRSNIRYEVQTPKTEPVDIERDYPG